MLEKLVTETNPLNDPEYHYKKEENRHPDYPHGVDWTMPNLHVTRLRLLGDPGFPLLDVSYCDGELDGYYVDVKLPFYQLPKRGYKKAIVDYAREDRVYAKRMGILDNISLLI